MLEVAANILYTAGLLAKFRGKHVGPVLEAVLPPNTRGALHCYKFAITCSYFKVH